MLATLKQVCDTAVQLTNVDGAAVVDFAQSSAPVVVYRTDEGPGRSSTCQFQLDVNEGPLLDAHLENRPYLCPRLGTQGQLVRWPTFCANLVHLNVNALFAFPVEAPESRATAVLVMYRGMAGDMDPREHQWAMVCASAIGRELQSLHTGD